MIHSYKNITLSKAKGFLQRRFSMVKAVPVIILLIIAFTIPGHAAFEDWAFIRRFQTFLLERDKSMNICAVHLTLEKSVPREAEGQGAFSSRWQVWMQNRTWVVLQGRRNNRVPERVVLGSVMTAYPEVNGEPQIVLQTINGSDIFPKSLVTRARPLNPEEIAAIQENFQQASAKANRYWSNRFKKPGVEIKDFETLPFELRRGLFTYLKDTQTAVQIKVKRPNGTIEEVSGFIVNENVNPFTAIKDFEFDTSSGKSGRDILKNYGDQPWGIKIESIKIADHAFVASLDSFPMEVDAFYRRHKEQLTTEKVIFTVGPFPFPEAHWIALKNLMGEMGGTWEITYKVGKKVETETFVFYELLTFNFEHKLMFIATPDDNHMDVPFEDVIAVRPIMSRR